MTPAPESDSMTPTRTSAPLQRAPSSRFRWGPPLWFSRGPTLRPFGVLALGLLLPAAGADAAAAQVGRGAAVAGDAVAAAHVEAVQEARALLDSVVAAGSIPGLSAAVGKGRDVLWSEGFGFADLTHGVLVTPLTKFRVGSVSKPITAAAMGLLMEAESLDLDAPVQRYVPSFPEKRWPVTTRQLAGHLGGVRHYRGNENLSAARYPTVLSGLAIFQDDSLIAEPGARYSYSSYGWNLISAVVEGASGEPFLPYMDRAVFRPLGMRHTVAGHTDSIIPHRTRFYVRAGDDGPVVNAPFVDNSYKWAGGGFLSTPEDLVAFAAAHIDGSGFLTDETLAVLFTSQRLSSGEETGYGIGWRTATNEHGETVVSHTGGSVGGTTVLTLNRDTGTIVAIVANLSNAPLGTTLAERVEGLFR